MYHRIGEVEDIWTRTRENFRADLEYLLAHGFYPVNLIDVVDRNLGHVPAGRRPVVLTFDDSTVGQFRYFQDGSVDPRCAVGILRAMHDKYGEDWPLRATFYVLLYENEPGGLLFGQPGYGAQKVRSLVEWGMEVGSHTIHHANLRVATADVVQWELAVSKNRVEALVPGYEVRSLALPEGSAPLDISLLHSGYSDSAELAYSYAAAVKVGAGPAPSPYSPAFDPYRIPRIRASQEHLDQWFIHVELAPERYYVSDGGQSG